ncbi:phospho-N-acetylmuramoyl-pentapeptide-transferase [Helicobacter sp. CLO-3]|uniref:phospho-N-acetylmuramoyl-pentapeptide- transferase n=2 Tax=unclassified Helicobacter TaxID=2593540 RepID=UPI000804E2B2|nr:phospho-N-acetylmuramoyl-pentapeptide-transferase [Helicobacter sp. CLO-3]OBV28794.1 phospho-N-acetylmuramoyl-pentapeptide-transferase [Helicobacter sp. CLO-3]OHU85864.1 phospho-N-acetylmuramoyl-pentapeptide-transferase [Helicobacter sp. CLO-3]
MLYYLYSHFDINIFKYLTFRAGISFFLAFLICVFVMPRFILWAKARKANQPISTFVPAHQSKGNTPTMGGSVFIASAVIASLLCVQLSNLFALLGIATIVIFGLIGMRDDYMKISRKSNAGMSARAKMLLLLVSALGISLALHYGAGLSSDFYIPFVKKPLFLLSDYPILMIAFWILVFLATSNAVNITDGLDGLASVPSICAIFTLCVFVYLSGNAELGKYLFLPMVNAGELMVVGVALMGALLGFLWYNCHPAQVFMGDSGSLGVGGFMAYMAIVSNNEVLLLIIGLIFVIETLSVMLQIGSYKTRKKRIFLMAPIHHHFEQKGWAENKIIVRFWIIAILSNIVALLSIKVR